MKRNETLVQLRVHGDTRTECVHARTHTYTRALRLTGAPRMHARPISTSDIFRTRQVQHTRSTRFINNRFTSIPQVETAPLVNMRPLIEAQPGVSL